MTPDTLLAWMAATHASIWGTGPYYVAWMDSAGKWHNTKLFDKVENAIMEATK